MMLPNQISTQRFSTVGKGGYRASEVDVFIQKVFQNYNKLYNDNSILRERLSSITPLIDEYNENKKAIANALIWAQTTSDKTVSEAKKEAERIVGEATTKSENLVADMKAEAEATYASELKAAEENLEKAKAELERIKSEAEKLSDKYLKDINGKAQTIINDANEKASVIVANAYSDAKIAKEKAEETLAAAKSELADIKKEASTFKVKTETVVNAILSALNAIDVDVELEEVVAQENTVEAESIDIDEIPAFTLDASDEATIEEEPEAFDDVVEYIAEPEESFPVNYEEAEPIPEADLISGPANTEMPDVSAYISKIFESVGSEESDFSSFTEGLNDLLADSLEDSEVSFEDLLKSMNGNEA